MKRIELYIIVTALIACSLGCQAQGFGFPPATAGPQGSTIVRVNAPTWVAPQIAETTDDDNAIASLNAELPMFQWMPVAVSGAEINGITYDLRIVEVMPGQAPDQAIRRNPKVYEVRALLVPQCLLPRTVLTALRPDAIYAAQISTRMPAGSRVQLIDGGRSRIMLFAIADNKTNPEK
ncbi:MAG: hypothetical protein ACI4A8_02565 [Muribaculaceae bacterium]